MTRRDQNLLRQVRSTLIALIRRSEEADAFAVEPSLVGYVRSRAKWLQNELTRLETAAGLLPHGLCPACGKRGALGLACRACREATVES